MYEIFEELCKKRGLKVSRACKEIGISPATAYNWRDGNYTPKLEKLQAIANYFDVSLDYLLTGKPAKVTEHDLKLAFFGGDDEVTDEMWGEALEIINYIKEKHKKS